MTKSELVPKQDDAQETITTNESNQTAHANRSRAGLWLMIILLVALTAGVGGAGYWHYTKNFTPLLAEIQSQRETAQLVQSVQDTQRRIQATSNANIESVETNKTAVEEVAALLSTVDKRVQRIDNEVAQMNGARASDWLLAEADYLVRMAGRKLWLEDDVRTAILLLQEADLRIEEVADPSLINVRKAIAVDIQTIQQINPVSVTSVALSLSGITSTIANLPLNALQLPDATSGAPAPVSENIADWRTNLANVWHAIMDDFVTIRKREAPIEPLMSDAQRFLAQEQLRLSLMQAQHAALNYDVTLYQEALKAAVSTIATHYDLNDPQVNQLLGALNNLQTTNIERNVPPALQAHGLLQNTLKRRTRQSNNTGSEI